jgi:thiamine-phosphate pyrophosphorylase
MPDRFYPIVPNAAWVARIVPLGVRSVQLRIKDRPQDEVAKEIATALAVCGQHGCELVVNDYWQLAIDLGAETIHLGQEDLAEADLPAIRRAGLKLGISTHTDEELEIALAAGPHHVALGPIYETTLKVMRYAPQGLDRIGQWKRRISCPLVAIGGITLERGPDVFRSGADVIAVVSDVVGHPDPDTRVRDWLRLAGSASPDRGA